MANVNCITKNNTDYMYEDTAGRNLIGEEQDTSTTAIKAYAVGDLFWLNNLLYRVTSNVASGGTLIVGTNCVATTVSAELASKATSTQLGTKQNKTLDAALIIEGESAATVETALSKLNSNKAGLSDLAPAFSTSANYSKNDCVVYEGDVYKFNQNHSGVWVASHADQIAVTEAGGHTMIPATQNDDDIDTIKVLTYSDASDEKVVNAYTIKKWSSVDRITLWTTVAKDADCIGAWNDTWETDGIRTGWIYHSLLAGVLSNNNVDMKIEFDPSASEPVSLAGWRIDDSYTYNGNTVGCIAIKLNAPVQNASGIKVAVVLDFKRNEVINVGTIS